MFFRPRKTNKLHAQKITYQGIEFDSIRECTRYQELLLLQSAGKISNLQLQVVYELLPDYHEVIETGEYYVKGAKKWQPKTKRICVEHGVRYIADFQYTDTETGETVVEDSKGYRNPKCATYQVFALKRKLMLCIHGIKVREV